MTYPPFPDAIGHLGRYAVQIARGDESMLAHYYSYDLRLIGNLGIDLLVEAFADAIGVEATVKWATVAVAPLMVIGLALISKGLSGRISPMLGFAAVFSFNYPFLFGFLNFALSASLSLVAFGLWVLLPRSLWLRFLVFVPLSFAIYVCHIFGWGMLGLLVFGYEAFDRQRVREIGWHGALSAGLRTAPLWLPIVHAILWRSGDAGGGIANFLSLDRKVASLLVSLEDRYFLADVLILACIAIPFVQAARKTDFHFDARVARIFMPLLVAFLLMPETIFGSAFADVRLMPYVVALYLLSIETSLDRRLVVGISIALFGLRATVTGYAAWNEASEVERHAAVFRDLERGSALYQINGFGCPTWGTPSLRLLGAYHIYRNHGFSNATWDMGGANPLNVAYELPRLYTHDPVKAASTWGCDARRLQRPQWLYDNLPRDRFDYVLFVERPKNLRISPGDRLVAKVGTTEVYRLTTSRDDSGRP